MSAATRRRRAVAVARAVRDLAVEADVTFLAAAIAYYAFVSMVPLVVLGLLVATTVGGPALAERLLGLTDDLLTPAGEAMLREGLTRRTGAGGVTAAGLVVLVWGSLKAVRAIDRAFSTLDGTERERSLLRSVAEAAVALSAVGAGLLAMLVIGAAVSVVPGPLVDVAGTGLLLSTLVVAFLPLYYVLPDRPYAVREVLPGAAVAAVGWTVLGAGFHLYAAAVGGSSVYGLLGGVLLALTWLYLGALLLLVGGALNAVLSGRSDR